MAGVRGLAVWIVIGASFAARAADDPLAIINDAKAKAVTIPKQAEALAALAWPAGEVDPAVSSLAREQLVGYGDRGLDAMIGRFRVAPARFAADITSAFLETRLVVRSNQPPSFIPSLVEILWFGPPEAKRLALPELAARRFGPAMLSFIDAAYEHPELTGPVISALGRLRDDRARHYLGEILLRADSTYTRPAAEALARIGGRAIDVLREASASPDELVRGSAIDALVPLSGVTDLTILYEYVAQFPDDDPRRIELVIQRATQLETLLEARQDVDAGSATDF
ncbi:MAG TPA: hypothetical protein VD788_16480 [Candidatus Polarisedimenticolaceae bacterium]|nr:hypothetical protein [Candidatus Polarisedimenticolaceae bacterium]